jgi:hypothetical protein
MGIVEKKSPESDAYYLIDPSFKTCNWTEIEMLGAKMASRTFS